MFGHNGKILRVNLSTGKIKEEKYAAEFARAYLGGNGFAASLIYEGVPAEADALGEDNAVVFAVGPLTDTPVWGTARGHLAALSPLTGFFADSNFGGKFANAQKRSGFDAIYITGKSEGPVYLAVSEEGDELKSATELWGMTTEETNRRLQEKEGKDSIAASIGPAGENLVLFASVIGGGSRPGAAGRGGIGAVMGSKKLKAVVASGSKKTELAEPEKLEALLAEFREGLKEKSAVLTSDGTPNLVDMINGKGMLCTHNASRETFESASAINANVLKEKYIVRNIACFKCPVACGKLVRVPAGEYAGRELKMPEYETIYAMGSMLDNADILSIINANGVCDLLGMDTITMGVTLAFVAECMEKGIITERDIGGKVNFADGEGLVELTKATAYKRGIGELLALGSKKLAEKFPPEAAKYVYGVKGMEIAGHSARGIRPMGLGYATATRGGSHHDTRPVYTLEDPGFDGQAEYNVQSQHFTAVGDSLIMCRFLEERSFALPLQEKLVEVINAVLGWEMDLAELETIGERIYNVERLINVRRGVSRKLDTLPYRVMNEPIPEGAAKGRYCSETKLNELLDEYYALRGWTKDGIPSDEKLEALGIK